MTSVSAGPGAQWLETIEVEKVWGREILPHPFAAPRGKRIGEIWFDPIEACDNLLIKYLFTSEKLSVQVHPSSSNAAAGEAGKEECWLVLDAEPGAQLAIGFKQICPPDLVAASARDGSIEQLLEWHDASKGDVFYLPAGTVHAIGPGLSLLEVQQNSDTTFRLYDYGRPRELHLERAMAVADCGPYSSAHRGKVTADEQCLVDAAHFQLHRVTGYPSDALCAAYSQGVMALPLQGELSIKGSGERAGSGHCLYAADIGSVDFGKAEVTLLTWG